MGQRFGLGGSVCDLNVEFGVLGSGFRVLGFGFGMWGLWIGDLGLGLGFTVWGSRFGFRVWGFGLGGWGLGFGVWDLGVAFGEQRREVSEVPGAAHLQGLRFQVSDVPSSKDITTFPAPTEGVPGRRNNVKGFEDVFQGRLLSRCSLCQGHLLSLFPLREQLGRL